MGQWLIGAIVCGTISQTLYFLKAWLVEALLLAQSRRFLELSWSEILPQLFKLVKVRQLCL